MENNPYSGLSSALNELASKINENKEAIAANLLKRANGSTGFRGQSFLENVDSAKGKMKQCFCTVCGNKISLHEKLPEGYCEYCGERIVLRSALNGKFEAAAIKNIPGKDLFDMSQELNDLNLLIAAAENDSIEALRELAYYYTDDDNNKALHYAKIGADRNDADCELFVIVDKYLLDKYKDDDFQSLKKRVTELNKRGFKAEHTNEVYPYICERIDLRLEIIEDRKKVHFSADDYRRIMQKAHASMYGGGSYNDDMYSSNRPSGTVSIGGQTHNVYTHDAEGYSTGSYIEDAEGYKTSVDPDSVSAPFDWRDC